MTSWIEKKLVADLKAAIIHLGEVLEQTHRKNRVVMELEWLVRRLTELVEECEK